MFALKTYAVSLFRLLFPKLCVVCGRPLVWGEKTLCLNCLCAMPRTHYQHQVDHPVEQLFWGKLPIERAMAWCHFVKGGTLQTLLHALKYHHRPDVGVVLGRQMALECAAWLQPIDAIVPIALHNNRLQKRGYNQAVCIAQGIASVMDVPVCCGVLVRSVDTATQTKMRVFERYENTQGIFSVTNGHELAHKHVLLVDDVITTGATLLAAAQTLYKEIPTCKISIATLAVASA